MNNPLGPHQSRFCFHTLLPIDL